MDRRLAIGFDGLRGRLRLLNAQREERRRNQKEKEIHGRPQDARKRAVGVTPQEE
jgi:hypothetical protein